MADVPSFLEVPGVPGGRIATGALSPEAQQGYLTQYGGAPTFPNTPGGVDRPVALMNPEMSDMQRASLASRSTFNAPPSTPQDQLAVANAIELAQSAPPVAAPTAPPPGNPSVPPGGPSGGPLGAATATLKGSFPMGYPDAGGPTSSIGGAYNKAQKAQDAATEAAVQRAVAEAEGVKAKAQLLDQQAQEAQAKEDQRQKLAGQSRKDIEAAQAQLNTPDGKVDPNRLWASKNAGQKVLAGIAVVLTGLGQGLQGRGGNDALALIQKQIDDDVQLQKETIAAERQRKKENFSATTQRHELLREQLGDERAVDAAERSMRYAAAEQTAAAKVAQMAPGEARARGEQLVADLGLRKAQAMDEASMRAAQFGLEKQKLGLQAMELGLKTAGGKAPPQLPAGEAVKVGELDAALGMLKDVGEAHSKLGTGSSFAQWIGGTKSAQYRDQMKVAAQVIGGILEGGKLTDPDYARYLEMMPKAGDFSPTAMNKVRSVAALLQRKRDGSLAALGSAGYDTSRFSKSTAQKRDQYGAVEH
jgi:hypothetical protein